jgi:hypothetical protein
LKENKSEKKGQTMPEKRKLNPQIASLEIGIRNLRTIKIYPLSFGDQLEMTDLITETIQKFIEARGDKLREDNVEFVQFIIDLLRKNLSKIIKLISDEENTLLKEITNVQVVDMVNKIYEMNYEESIKNAQSLFEKIKPMFQSTGQ